MEYVYCVLIGYLLGSVNPAFLVGRAKGFDIRQRGSNNAGASNAVVVMGAAAGILVGALDIAKSFCAALICRRLFPQLELAAATACAGAVLGHIFPVWLRFKGGKGLACYFGMIFALDWRAAIGFGLLVAVITIVTDYIAIGTIATGLLFPVYLYVMGAETNLTVVVALISLLMLSRHTINIRRMISGEEIGLRRRKNKDE